MCPTESGKKKIHDDIQDGQVARSLKAPGNFLVDGSPARQQTCFQFTGCVRLWFGGAVYFSVQLSK